MSEIIQGSPAWFAIRLGKVTASRIADLTATTKSGWGASRKNYLADLAAERLTGVPAISFTNAAMQWGTETEPLARVAYQFFQDAEVEQIGFVPHPTISMAGASPDGLIGADGLVEIKCPSTATHIDTLLGREIPSKYLQQMQFQMACTGRQWCDFVSFDPRMPESLRLFTARLERDRTVIAAIEDAVRVFLSELDQTVAALMKIAA